ncbi:hypothetical protein NUW54_g8820 [Trametes sanguinea]|uniref:Uncharacterized protein n=1 Tax=Trametes sanguinea TaxID=158606 RepID=A0ACC1PAJ7_9APHY|nr:hypothetical protein NUW54_g8820 [Trametes sanguinea]
MLHRKKAKEVRDMQGQVWKKGVEVEQRAVAGWNNSVVYWKICQQTAGSALRDGEQTSGVYQEMSTQGFGLFHQQEAVRELAVDLFNELRAYPIGVQFLQALNHFQRYAYVRQAHAKEQRLRDANSLSIPQSAFMSRSPSNRSESSLGGGG